MNWPPAADSSEFLASNSRRASDHERFFRYIPILGLAITIFVAARPAAAEETVWPSGIVRVDPSAQKYERLPSNVRPFSNPAVVPGRLRLKGFIRVHDSASFTHQAKRYAIAGIEPIPGGKVCLRPDGTRWACGLDSRLTLQNMLGASGTICRVIGDAAVSSIVSCATKGRDLSGRLVGDGLATMLPGGSLDHR